MHSKSVWRWCAFAFLLVPVIARAQFQQPTPEELKMTADPSNPDASAVILNLDDRTDDVNHYTSHYARIKILKENAKELGTVTVGYEKGPMNIAEFSGRTIHPDGTIVPAEKPTDLLKTKIGDREFHQVVLNLPSVEVGSIIEYYYQVRYNFQAEYSTPCDQPNWQLQGQYSIRKEHYVFVPCAGILDNTPGLSNRFTVDSHGRLLSDLLWYTHLPEGVKFGPSAAHLFDLTLTDVPSLPNEPFMPPVESQRYEVRFYFAPGNSATEYWNTEAKYWLKDVDRFADPTGTLKAAVAGIVAPSDSATDKAKKLYAAVQALDNTDFSRTKSNAELKAEGLRAEKRAEDTWNDKSGDSQQIALLYLAMLRAAGLTAYPMKIVDRQTGMFNAGYLNFNQLNATVIILDADGKETVLDPGEKMCPFGMVDWRHSGAGGIRQSAKGIDSWITPLLAYSDNTVVRRADLTYAADGSVSGRVQFGMTGQEALHWRQAALREDPTAVQKQFEDWIATQIPRGVLAHFTRFARLDDPSGELEAYATVSGTSGTVAGKRLIVPALFFVNHEDRLFFQQPSRRLPVDMHYASRLRDGVLYHLPPGYTPESLPTPSAIPWPQHAVFQMKAASVANGVTVVSDLSRAFTFLQPDEYSALRDFYQKVAGTDQQQIVLDSSAQAKTN